MSTDLPGWTHAYSGKVRDLYIETGTADLASAQRVLMVASDRVSAFDHVLSPVSPVPAFAAEWASPLNDPLQPFEHIAFTVPYNMSEQPAAAINCGYTAAGLPIGLQIIGKRFDDLGVLQMAAAFEHMRGAQRPWPGPK